MPYGQEEYNHVKDYFWFINVKDLSLYSYVKYMCAPFRST